jgi:membrane-bound hydrogenase subunit beta
MSLETQIKLLEGLVEEFGGDKISNASSPRLNESYVQVRRESLREVVTHLKEEGFEHIITISGVDWGDRFEVVYHLLRGGLNLNVKVPVPKDDVKVPSITDILNGAVLYEREVNDLFGVFPTGHPNPARLILDYDWPEGLYPLRKDETLQGLREKVDGRQWGRDVE